LGFICNLMLEIWDFISSLDVFLVFVFLILVFVQAIL